MLEPPLPHDEVERLAALKALNILDTPVEERFERIARLARRCLGTPIAALSLVDRDRQWFKTIQGLDCTSTERRVAFCAHTILSEETLVVGDATRDSRFADNPLVTASPYIVAYAGHPLHSGGQRVGSLCVIDHRPRVFGPDDLQLLRDLAALAELELNTARIGEAQRQLLQELRGARRRALLDPLTRLWNREGIIAFLEQSLEQSRDNRQRVCAILLDLDHFKAINDHHGHLAGDAVLQEVARRMLSCLREGDAVGRYGGEEFLAVAQVHEQQAPDLAERLHGVLAARPVEYQGLSIPITASVGLAWSDGSTPGAYPLLEKADRALYRAKAGGRNRVMMADAAAVEEVNAVLIKS